MDVSSGIFQPSRIMRLLSRSCGCDRVQARSRLDVVPTPSTQRNVRDRSVTEGHESDVRNIFKEKRQPTDRALRRGYVMKIHVYSILTKLTESGAKIVISQDDDIL